MILLSDDGFKGGMNLEGEYDEPDMECRHPHLPNHLRWIAADLAVAVNIAAKETAMELAVIIGAPVVVAWLISRLASRRWSRRVLFFGALGLYFLVINRPGSMVVRGKILSYLAEPWMAGIGYALLGIAGLFLLLRWLSISSRQKAHLVYCQGFVNGSQHELQRQLRWR